MRVLSSQKATKDNFDYFAYKMCCICLRKQLKTFWIWILEYRYLQLLLEELNYPV